MFIENGNTKSKNDPCRGRIFHRMQIKVHSTIQFVDVSLFFCSCLFDSYGVGSRR